MTATDQAILLAREAASAAAEKLATGITAVDVSSHLALTDVFVIVAAETERQVIAIVDGIEDRLREREIKALRREGTGQARWVLLDFGDIVVHVQREEERDFYDLARLWRDCPLLDLGGHG